jgi:hypothetical protein
MRVVTIIARLLLVGIVQILELLAVRLSIGVALEA